MRLLLCPAARGKKRSGFTLTELLIGLAGRMAVDKLSLPLGR